MKRAGPFVRGSTTKKASTWPCVGHEAPPATLPGPEWPRGGKRSGGVSSSSLRAAPPGPLKTDTRAQHDAYFSNLLLLIKRHALLKDLVSGDGEVVVRRTQPNESAMYRAKKER
jgi:hypothetical protein